MERYNLNAAEVGTVKRACRFMSLDWKAEAARPVSARRLVDAVDRLGVESGCEEWSREQFGADGAAE